MLRLWRRRWAALGLTLALCCVLTYLYRADLALPVRTMASEDLPQAEPHVDGTSLVSVEEVEYPKLNEQAVSSCTPITKAKSDIDTCNQFKHFDFQPYWLKSREYWDSNFENRYLARKKQWKQMPLKVIVIPHSHNDPGWLKTFESYYHYQTRNILNNMVDKLNTLANMTFIWTEISFLAQWWMGAHPVKRKMVQKLVDEGRLEITTGGWVMTDEATSHVYAMLDQLIEGHQWLRLNLGVKPKTGWSIDPFGHGSTVPYLLKHSGVDSGTVIQRIHYAWKQWLAEQRMSDFLWRQNWDSAGTSDLLVHNQPFDIYSIKHSCGPHPQVCLNFDFRKISGEYTEYSLRAVAIDEENVKQKAELLLDQYGRTGSLFPHNVVLMPVGDDFRYDHDVEWDQQYRNYKRLFDYINANFKLYNADIRFGTVNDYFKEVAKRQDEFKTMKGDFFVYSDIFSEGRPAYWSGYFTTRPYWKMLDRQLEADLRSGEILYTLALNRARLQGCNSTVKILERDYEKLNKARQSLALFQHHDAITGTSKSAVMHDYALKLFEAQQESISLQSYSLQTLLTKPDSSSLTPSTRFVFPDLERETYERLPRKIQLNLKKGKSRKIVVFNSLGQVRYDSIKVLVNTPNVLVKDSEGELIPHQINPIWNLTEPPSIQTHLDDKQMGPELTINNGAFELFFLVKLAPLSLTTFTIENSEKNGEYRSTVYCKGCGKSPHFEVKNMQVGDVQLENQKLKLLVDGRTGLLKSITNKETGKIVQCGLQFGAYPSAQFHSGAYLFMPDPNAREIERDVLEDYPGQRIVIVSGPVTSKLTVVYGNFLVHTIRIFHSDSPLGEGVFVQNTVDFEAPPKNRETELFMRLVTEVNNGDPPEFYSDLNGFQTQKRVKVERVGIEGNYFPVTSHAYIEDAERRITLLMDYSHGAAAWQPGWLEVMLDRRTLYDDSRGMGEGIVDNKPTLSKFWIIPEDIVPSSDYSSPTLLANYLSLTLLYPPNTFILEPPEEHEIMLNTDVRFLPQALPCDVHLMNLRTLPDSTLQQFPSSSALLILHRLGYSCTSSSSLPSCVPLSASSSKVFNRRKNLFTNFQTSVSKSTLTGTTDLIKYSSLDQISLSPMNIMTFNVTFKVR